MKERNPNIDTARGIAIFLVIIGHCISEVDNPINRFILSFHMPLFFVISGMLMSNNQPQLNFLQYFHIEAKRLLLPQVLLGFLFYLYFAFYSAISSGTLELFAPYQLFLRIISPWFLIVMFGVTLIAYYYRKYIADSLIMTIIFNAFIILLTIYLQYKSITNPYLCNLNIVPMAWLFYILGSIFKKQLSKSVTKRDEIIFVITIPVVYILAQINTPVRMYSSDYGIIYLFLVSAFSASFVIIRNSQLINSKMLQWAGKNSMAIYVFQFPIHMIYHDLFIVMFNHFGIQNQMLLIGFNILFSLSTTLLFVFFSSKSRVMRFIFEGHN